MYNGSGRVYYMADLFYRIQHSAGRLTMDDGNVGDPRVFR
jgi:hypothetical protein